MKSEDLLIISSMKAKSILIMIHKQETDKRFLQKINQLFGKKKAIRSRNDPRLAE